MTQRELIEKIYKDLEDVIEESNNVNYENEERILKELALLMLYFNVSNNKLQLSNMQIMKIKNKIFKLIDDIFDDEIEDIIEKMSSSLVSTAHKVERYYGEKVNDDFVNSKFKNKTFKERHSQNSTEVKNKLKSTVFKFIKGGIAIGLIKNSIDKIYKIHKYNIIRLLKTEINRVQNRLFLELNKNKKFRYCSVFERNTCADCKSLDGHIFNYKEALDLIPQHSNCLCYWEVIDDKTNYEKYKGILVENASKTLKDSQGLNYNNSNEQSKIRERVLQNIEKSKIARKASNYKEFDKKAVRIYAENNNWMDKSGNIIWPPNKGFEGKPSIKVLDEGTKIDRYGYEGGTFVSPLGVPYSNRALAPGTYNKPYTVYEVIKPVKVKAGEIAPWFNEPGGGIQYELYVSVEKLIKDGFIRRVEIK